MLHMKAILYFISDAFPTAKEQTDATKLSKETGERVVFRNVSAIVESDPIEQSLGAAGLIPDGYTEYKVKKKTPKKETTTKTTKKKETKE